MSLIKLQGNASGTGAFTIAAPNGNTDRTLTLPDATGTVLAAPAGAVTISSSAPSNSLTLDGSGNLGLGVTPSAWWSGRKVLQIGGAGGDAVLANSPGTANFLSLSSNYYLDASPTARYVNSGAATVYQQASGAHQWLTAPSGTAGNVATFTQAMTLDANGRLLIGTTTGVGGDFTSVRFNSGGSYPQALNMVDSNASASNSVFQVFRKSDDTYLGNIRRNGTDNAIFVGGNSYLALGSGDTERARIDASGNLLVGTTEATGKVTIRNNSTSAPPFIDISNRAQGSGFVQGGIRFESYRDVAFPSYAAAIWSYQDYASPGNSAALVFGARANADGNLPTERMRINADGQKVHNYDSGATTKEIFNWSNNTTGMSFRSASVQRGSIYFLDTGVSFNTTSDYRLKEDWQPLTGASERVLALKPVNFAWKENGKRVDGFLAHEAQAVVPEAVTGAKDEVDDEGNPKYQGIDQSKLVPLLTAALQEALAEIANLKTRLTALEAN